MKSTYKDYRKKKEPEKPKVEKDVNVVGYTPFEWQVAVHKGLKDFPHDIHVMKSKRQIGKSLMCENILLEKAVNNPNTTSIMIEPTMGQCRKVFKEIVNAIGKTPVYKSANSILYEIHFTNGSQILLKSGEMGDNLRGFTISKNGILIFDECAYIKDDVIFNCLPFVDVNNAPVLMVSTPKFKQGGFFEFFNKGELGVTGFHSYDVNTFDTSRLLTPEKLELYKQSLPLTIYKSEYLGLWLEQESQIFGSYGDCISDVFDTTEDCYFGIDWGACTGNDETAIVVLNGKKQMIGLHHFNNKDETETIKFIGELALKYRPRKITVETNSIGNIFYGLLQKEINNLHINTTLRKFVTTNDSKRRIINNLQIAFQNKGIQILNDIDLKVELNAYQLEQTKSGKSYTYNAQSGFNDDLVVALAIAFDSISTGVYHIK